MPQFIIPEMLDTGPPSCAHEITAPEVFQDEGDKLHRASWTLASTCKRCGEVFVYGSGYGYWEDRFK